MEETKIIFRKDDDISMKLYNMCELRKELINDNINEVKVYFLWDILTINYDEESDWFFINNNEEEPLYLINIIEYFFKKVFN